MDKIQENTKIEKAILAEKQQIFLIQNKLSEIEKNIKEQCLTIEQIQNSITEKNQNLSNIEYKENQSIHWKIFLTLIAIGKHIVKKLKNI
ncbi:hypothetical protein RAP57_03555 [Campylobacter jejuni]|nr:hypothetical protein [Campylobacter jejuni]